MAETGTNIAYGDNNHAFQAGIINGPVHNEFHAAPARPHTPPAPSTNLPFRRDADFVHRGLLLDQISKQCAVPGSWTALVGLGGVGKSQLAIEYCYRILEKSPQTWALWVHASNAARFEQSFRDIADCLKIHDRHSAGANIFKLVHDWLCNSNNGKWVLVLDNVDDAGFLLASQNAPNREGKQGPNNSNPLPLQVYLPKSRNGSILVTSRTREAASALVEDDDIVDVPPMQKAEALKLLQRKLRTLGDSDGVEELGAALEFMPLAIVQAAAYIAQRAPRCSVRQYLEKFHNSEHDKTSLLNYEAGQLRRDREATNSIIITWQISFEHMQRSRPSAAELLSLMSFFDRQGIPESLVRHRSKVQTRATVSPKSSSRNTRRLKHRLLQFVNSRRNKRGHKGDDDAFHSKEVYDLDNDFESDLLVLRNYSFIVIAKESTTAFEMHSLVQLATRRWLQSQGQLERWKEQFISNLCAEFPNGEFENWETCQSFYPHVKAALLQRPHSTASLTNWASLLFNASWYAWRRGRLVESEHMAAVSMETRTELFGEENKDTLDSMAMVGLLWVLEGQGEKAERLLLRVVEMKKRVLGEENPSTLTSTADLALTYQKQGRWTEAEKLNLEAVEMYKKVLGPEHPDTLTCTSNLALNYWKQSRLAEAEETNLHVLEVRKRLLGAEHPQTLVSMSNLASMYLEQGRMTEAEELELQVVEIRKRVLGEEHSDTLESLHNLAFTLQEHGQLNAAIDLLEQVHAKYITVIGPQHPNVISSSATLAQWKQERSEMND